MHRGDQRKPEPARIQFFSAAGRASIRPPPSAASVELGYSGFMGIAGFFSAVSTGISLPDAST
jgi:hypothetical protein